MIYSSKPLLVPELAYPSFFVTVKNESGVSECYICYVPKFFARWIGSISIRADHEDLIAVWPDAASVLRYSDGQPEWLPVSSETLNLIRDTKDSPHYYFVTFSAIEPRTAKAKP